VVSFWLLTALLLARVTVTRAIEVTPGEMAEARCWVAAKFQGMAQGDSAEAALVVLANHDPVLRNTRGEGRPLTIGKVTYARGFYCHAVSRVVVRLPRSGKTFSAVAGVDSNPQTDGGRGSVVFAVEISDKKTFRSQLMREGMAGVDVNVDLAGAKELALVVEDGGDGITCDQADWADAKVALDDGTVVWLGDLPIVGEDSSPTTEPPFSFVYDGKPSAELLKAWGVKRETRKLNEKCTEHALIYADPKTGLEVRCVAVE
jgi:hypothetical protein